MKDLFKYFILPVIILYLIGVALHFALHTATSEQSTKAETTEQAH